ncbi:metallophosphoesterase [Peptoniphilaceae bacterium SGI.137]
MIRGIPEVPKKKKHRIRWKRLMLFCVIVWMVLGSVVTMVRSNLTYRVARYQVESAAIPNAFNGYKILQISDVHGRIFGKDGESLTKTVEEEQPNMVVITGDLLSRNSKNSQEMTESLKQIAKEFPVYYIRGNHEMWRDLHIPDQDQFYEQLRSIGVTVMSNEVMPILFGGSRVFLAGLQEPLSSYNEGTDFDMTDLLGKKPEGYTVLLAHNPLLWEKYREWGAELTISGHVHGGVVRLPLIGGIFSPDKTFFPKYDRGLYQENQKAMVVSAGLGKSAIPFRFLNPLEVVVITLRSQSIH